MWTASGLGLLAVLAAVDADISVFTQATPHSIMEEFLDMPADFGLDIPVEGIRGFLVEGAPKDGCSNMTKPPVVDNFTGRWIVLIANMCCGSVDHAQRWSSVETVLLKVYTTLCSRHNCSFETQIRNAQAAGFDAAIVHNVNSSQLEVMTADDADGINIPSVFVSDLSGLILSEEYVYSNGFYIMVNDAVPFNINTRLLLPFAVVVFLSLLVVLIFAIVKCIKDRRRARRHRLPNNALKKIPTYKFSKGDPYETCAICLDDYQEGDKLRVLPCAHAYHTICIDPWLTQNKRVCPVCKRRVFAAGERRALSDSSDADADESQPLLRSVPPAGGTFDEQRENPFARATRFMARLRARANGDPEIPPSPPNDHDHMNVANINNDDSENTSESAGLVPRVEVTLQRDRRPRRSRRATRARTRAASAPDAAPAGSAQGEIGVAALPAPGTRRVNL